MTENKQLWGKNKENTPNLLLILISACIEIIPVQHKQKVNQQGIVMFKNKCILFFWNLWEMFFFRMKQKKWCYIKTHYINTNTTQWNTLFLFLSGV